MASELNDDQNHHSLPSSAEELKVSNAVETRRTSSLSSQWKMQVAGVAGNALEWYDFSCFGYFSDFFANNFFPADQSYQSKLLSSFVIFGVAFVVRPIGGAIIGVIGDANTAAAATTKTTTTTTTTSDSTGTAGGEDSRTKAVRVSILIMVIPTFLLGCLPTYEQVGYLATFLLIVTRLIQGLSVGGQIMSSAVFAMERSPRDQWGFWGSTVFTASSVGVTIGSAVSYILRQSMTNEHLLTYGWRIPFWFALIGAIPGYYLKEGSEEEEHNSNNNNNNNNNNNKKQSSPPPPSVLSSEDSYDKTHDSTIVAAVPEENYDSGDDTQTIKVQEKRDSSSNSREESPLLCSRSNLVAMLSSTLVVFMPAAFYYIVFVWLAMYMQSIRDPPMPHAFGINTVVGLISLPLNLVGGWVTDALCSSSSIFRFFGYSRFTYKTVMYLSLGCTALSAPPLLYMLSLPTTNVYIATLFQLIMATFLALYNGSMLPFLVSIFPKRIRLTSMSVGYNIGICLCGGFAPALSTYLVGTSYGIMGVGLYVTILSFLSAIGVYFGPTHRWIEGEETNDSYDGLQSTNNNNNIDNDATHQQQHWFHAGEKKGISMHNKKDIKELEMI